jgi:hypothetical protein
MNKIDGRLIVVLFFNTTMADSYDIYKSDIRKMVRDEIFDLIDLKYAIGKEYYPEFTGTTEDELAEYLVDTKLELFETEIGKISLCIEYIRNYLNLDNGDVVKIGGNENIMFWSSTEGLLYADTSSPQLIPMQFRVGNGKDEFAPWHWIRAINHYDGSIWLSDSLRDEIIGSLKRSLSKTVIANPFHTEVIIHGRRMHIFCTTAAPKYFRIIEENVIEGEE